MDNSTRADGIASELFRHEYRVLYVDDGSKKRNIVPGVPKEELYCLENQSKPESRGEQQ